MLLVVLLSLGVILSASCVLKYLNGLRSVGNYPGFRVPFAPFSPLGCLIPTTWWNPGITWPWKWRHIAYFNNTHDIISMVPFCTGKPCFYTRSLEVTKQLMQHEGKHLIKPPELMGGVLFWGDNLLSSNGDMWKKHRRIIGPAFTSKTYPLVWKECVALYKEMVVAEGWRKQNSVFISEIGPISAKFTFAIIARCGFGLPMPWVEHVTNSQELSFGDSLRYVLRTVLLRLAIPSWAYTLPIKRLHHLDHVWKSLTRTMYELVAAKRLELSSAGDEAEKRDIFSLLVSAYDEDIKYGLEEQEVVANTFIFMLAGHDTSSNVLTATLGFLAIHQDEQEKAYQEIQRVIPHDCEPEYHDASQLTHLLACFWEALRIYPPAFILIRELTEDLPIITEHPRKETIVFRKGSCIVADLIAMNHNADIFPEPDKFQPSRWINISDSGVNSFGVGPRACIGRKFAQVEAICFMCMLLREWKLDINLENGETRQEYEERVMGNARISGISFGVGPVSLKLTRRT